MVDDDSHLADVSQEGVAERVSLEARAQSLRDLRSPSSEHIRLEVLSSLFEGVPGQQVVVLALAVQQSPENLEVSLTKRNGPWSGLSVWDTESSLRDVHVLCMGETELAEPQASEEEQCDDIGEPERGRRGLGVGSNRREDRFDVLAHLFCNCGMIPANIFFLFRIGYQIIEVGGIFIERIVGGMFNQFPLVGSQSDPVAGDIVIA